MPVSGKWNAKCLQSDTEHLAKFAGFHEISGGDIGDLPKEHLELKQVQLRTRTGSAQGGIDTREDKRTV